MASPDDDPVREALAELKEALDADDWDDRSSVTIQLPPYQAPRESSWPSRKWTGVIVAALTVLGTAAEVARRLLTD